MTDQMNELDGLRKANGLLLKGMESQAEEMDRLKQENRRLLRGDFTEEEFQNLCHHLDEGDRDRFCAGCTAYQRKLFGTSAVDLEREAWTRVFSRPPEGCGP